jgi:hypothetical protein
MPCAPSFIALLLASCSAAVLAGGTSATGRSAGGPSPPKSVPVSKPAGAQLPAATPKLRAAMASAVQPGHAQKPTSGGPRSLLAAGPPPSARLTEVIHERETLGVGGLMGMALLVSLFNRPDLTADDRGWIEGRIAALRAEDLDAANALLPAAQPKVRFDYAGLEDGFVVGRPARLSIAAQDDSGRPLPLPLQCAVAEAQIVSVADRVEVSWTPDADGSRLMVCCAGQHQERRLLLVRAR